jgi:hypothetical protein
VEEEAELSSKKSNINEDITITVFKCTNEEGINV